MADEPQPTSPKNEAPHAEDAETRATRRELKQSSISDPDLSADKAADSSKNDTADRPETPEEEDLKDQVASPKKKRAHDQLDSSRDKDDAASVASADSGRVRSERSEPEKKRARDEEAKKIESDKKDDGDKKEKDTTEKPTETSSSAFAVSGFGKLAAAGTSGFASLGGAKLSGFGSPNKTPLVSFSSGAAPTSTTQPLGEAPKLSFGGASGASPFGGLPAKTNGFGSGLGGSAFSALSGAKPLSTFGSGAGKPLPGQKATKAFGAPESDAEESDGRDDGDDGDDNAETPENERAASPEKDDKKKPKLHKVEVDDGEAGEATILSVRAKIFAHEKDAWKERGAGMLKINVPSSCVEFEDSGAVVPGSFDASGLDADEEDGNGQPKVVRLVMRQDQTHRVILNTALIPAMEFQEKASLKSVAVLFTAFEGQEGKPVTITMRMSAANAKLFTTEIDSIQRELRDR